MVVVGTVKIYQFRVLFVCVEMYRWVPGVQPVSIKGVKDSGWRLQSHLFMRASLRGLLFLNLMIWF